MAGFIPDQGSPFTAARFKAPVAKHGAPQSMSRRGKGYDNAHAEFFWSRFKAELSCSTTATSLDPKKPSL